MLVIELELELLAKERQRGLDRDLSLMRLLKQAEAVPHEPRRKPHERLHPATQFLMRLAAQA